MSADTPLRVVIADDDAFARRVIKHALQARGITVVAEAKDVDTALLLGAGWPFWLGGITKYLDQTGISEKMFGRPLAEVGAGAPTT